MGKSFPTPFIFVYYCQLMSQLFHPLTNIIVKIVILGGVLLLIGLAGLGYYLVTSPYLTGVGVARAQPVPYSHEQHVGGLGLDCRYCHSSVDESSFAGLPSTATCLGCHTQIKAESPHLEPVRASMENNRPMTWIRVHNLPDFVFFNHGIHVNKGVGCETCHGRIDQMPVVAKAVSLHMEWCLECHRAPEQFIRPRAEVLTMGWQPPVDQATLGAQLVTDYDIAVDQLTDCSICHR